MTDWEIENEIQDEIENDWIDICAEHGELNDYQKDKLQGITEMKLAGKFN